MQVLPSFDPSASTSGNINVSAADSGCKILLYNLSIYAILLNFDDGSTALLHAGEANWWELDGSTPTIAWSQYSKLNITSPAISQVSATLYRQDEELEGTYPAFFGYQFNVGNVVTTSQGATLSIQNDGNGSGTQFVESTVSGSPGSNIIMQVQGLIEVLQWANSTLTQIFKVDPGASSVVKLGNTGLLSEVLGNLTVDQVLTAVGNTSLSTLSTSGKATLNSAEVSGTFKADTTSEFVGNVTFDANPILSNAEALQAKDSGGTARTILQVDGSNNLQFFGITGNDKAQFLDHSGNLSLVMDFIAGCLSIDNSAITTINGGTAGTAKHWMPFQGTSFKMVIIEENGFQTGASNQTYSLPTAFTDGAFFWTGSVVTWSFANNGVAQSCNMVTAFGSASFQSTVTGYTFGNLAPQVAFNQIVHNSGAGSQHTGWIIIIGK